MFWNKFWGVVSKIPGVVVVSYVLYDAFLKSREHKSFVVNIIALFIFSAYNILVGILNRIMWAVEYIGSIVFIKQQDYQSLGDFEKLLNDFGDSEWKLDR